jgi:hypothetical protein
VAGYSQTPLAKKLGIKQGNTVLVIDPPDDLAGNLEPLPSDTTVTSDITSSCDVDVILLFCTSQGDLHRHLRRSANMLTPSGGLWIAWPKKSSGYPSDLDFACVQAAGLALGLVDNKVCAVNETFSGLRFVVRVKNLASWAAGTRL